MESCGNPDGIEFNDLATRGDGRGGRFENADHPQSRVTIRHRRLTELDAFDEMFGFRVESFRDVELRRVHVAGPIVNHQPVAVRAVAVPVAVDSDALVVDLD